MKELNKLTQKLLLEGYTKENPPDFVKPWNKYYGGWEYTTEKQGQLVFETPCGLLVKGSYWNSGYMSFMGIDWTLENNNPVINCPYSKIGCEFNHKLLRNSEHSYLRREERGLVFCACSITSEEYDYEKSIYKILDDERKRQKELLKDFLKQHPRACEFHCLFNYKKNQWEFKYNPDICLGMPCQYCTVLGRKLSTKKGNIFYDVKTTTLKKGEGLFPDEYLTEIVKGIRYFEKQKNIDLCNQKLKIEPDCCLQKEKLKHHSALFFAEHHNVYFKLEVMNVRAETRETRDIDQDLEDIENGLKVVHNSDLIASNQAVKRENREKAQKQRVKKALKLITEKGYGNLERIELNRIIKFKTKGLISQDEINRADAEWQRQKIEVQTSLF